MAPIDFWYSIGSTYSYLTVMRLADVAKRTKATFNWRPFNVRHVMTLQNNIPFKDKPVKTAYMWRDIARRAERFGLTPRLPAPYPLPGLVLANQVATLGVEEGWCETYTREAYRLWFEMDEPAGQEPNLTLAITHAGADPERVLSEARGPRIEGKLQRETETAMRLGIFGSPTFAVGDEIFWGDDRLDDAIDWARRTA